MTKSEDTPSEFMIGQVSGIHRLDGETHVEVRVASNMSPEDQRQVVSEFTGIPIENIVHPRDPGSMRSASRAVIGFARWRSSWDPHAEKNAPIDPNLN